MSETNEPSNKASTPSQQDRPNTTSDPNEQAQTQQACPTPIVVLGSTHTPEPASPPTNQTQDPCNPTGTASSQPEQPALNPALLQPPPTEGPFASAPSPATTSSSTTTSTGVSTPTSTSGAIPATQEPQTSNPASMSSSSSSSPGNTGTSGPTGSTTQSGGNPAYHLPYAPFPFRMPDGTSVRGSGGSSSGGGKGK
ncbi:hypothetical protein BU16DRAFT_542356 [Lophium mytilinum]|uniref:Uncharacterized protein n=1 Tax=Lophium mytilinum TaxID=390894 RepID=A0A6A6QL83_9PEZI|nr:hypothetical protein BU16DRAFT_542356 [Lophium mytilinum]